MPFRRTSDALRHAALKLGRQQWRYPLSKGRDRTVYQRDDGKWANRRNDASKPSSLHRTQAGAQKRARKMLTNQGGGELTTKGVDGKIRDKDTVAPGNDPRNIKG
ncbi:MAG: DUF2188 domain-containing protein [Hyphomicrobiaceae bacterium]